MRKLIEAVESGDLKKYKAEIIGTAGFENHIETLRGYSEKTELIRVRDNWEAGISVINRGSCRIRPVAVCQRVVISTNEPLGGKLPKQLFNVS